MAKHKVGDRVGAIRNTDEEQGTVFLFGYGTYQGDEVPPQGIKAGGFDLHLLNIPNPKIVLDDGKVVWGCECWWGPAYQIEQFVSKFSKVIIVDVEKRKGIHFVGHRLKIVKIK